MMWRMMGAILVLPGTALILVPAVILWATAGGGQAGDLSAPSQPQFWIGLAAWGMGMLFGIWTARLFVAIGRGTPAPVRPGRRRRIFESAFGPAPMEGIGFRLRDVLVEEWMQ